MLARSEARGARPARRGAFSGRAASEVLPDHYWATTAGAAQRSRTTSADISDSELPPGFGEGELAELRMEALAILG
eukprot:3008934-Alexandrium_andersonii.AAC.1